MSDEETKSVEHKLGKIASRHLHPRHVTSGLDNFKKHLQELPEEHVEALGKDDHAFEKYADEFFKGAASEAPELESESTESTSSSGSGSGSGSYSGSSSLDSRSSASTRLIQQHMRGLSGPDAESASGKRWRSPSTIR